MTGFVFRKNTVFEWNGTKFRIDRLPSDGKVLLERVDNGGFSIVTREELLVEYSHGNVSATAIDDLTSRIAIPSYSRLLIHAPN